jgi:hypothetical protein
VLHCSQRNATSLLRLACCARGRVVLYHCQRRPPNPPSPLCRPHSCAWLSCARKRAACIIVGRDPRSLSLCYSQTFLHSAISMRRRILLSHSKIHRRATPRKQPHRVVVLGAWPAASAAGARLVVCSALRNKRFSLVCTPKFKNSWGRCRHLLRAVPAAMSAGARTGALLSRTRRWLRLYCPLSGFLSR